LSAVKAELLVSVLTVGRQQLAAELGSLRTAAAVSQNAAVLHLRLAAGDERDAGERD